jgi:hypothetical protein
MKLQWLLPVLFVMSFALPPIAKAQLLYSGGEDVDFLCNSGSACSVGINGQSHRTGWAREAYDAVGSATDPPTNRFATPVFTAHSTIWVHAQYCGDSGSACTNQSTASSQMLRVMDSSGNPTIIIVGTGTAARVTISSRTSAGVFTTLATCSSAVNASLTQLDLFIRYGTAGEVTLYNNSVQVCDFSGNVTNGDGATTLDQVEFASPVTNGTGAWSEVIVDAADTRAMSRFTANTVANGNTVGFSGTNVCSAIWNATVFNDANFGFSGTSNVLHECTINSAIPAGAYTVVGLVMSARALVGSSGPLHFDFLTRVGTTDFASANFTPTTTFSNLTNYIQTVNPATSAAWAITDFQAAGFNVGEETKP